MTSYMNEMKPGEIQKGNFKKVIFGVGSTESHGAHMPIGTDNLIAHAMAERIAAAFTDMLLLPPVNYGVSEYHRDFPFTLYVKSETMIATIRDICEAIYFRGIRQIIIINGHDGNISPLEIVGRQVKMQYPDLAILTLPAWWLNFRNLVPAGLFSDYAHGHGGEAETSLLMAFYPELIDLSLAVPMIPKLKEDSLLDMKVNFRELSNVGSTGNPQLATPEKARVLAETMIQHTIDYIKYLDSIDWKYAVE
ncbi:MAG: creatininase family protein [Symbiobacteriaceae bacterium]|nr:creatininase family protein [Symbiobacteriaceae bacterium]